MLLGAYRTSIDSRFANAASVCYCSDSLFPEALLSRLHFRICGPTLTLMDIFTCGYKGDSHPVDRDKAANTMDVQTSDLSATRGRD